MAHFSIDALRERQREGGVETPLPKDAEGGVETPLPKDAEGGVETPLPKIGGGTLVPQIETGEQDGGVGTKATEQSAEELTQSLGSNDGDSSGEFGGSGGVDEWQTDTDNDVAGLGDAKSETKSKSRAK